PEVIGAAVMMDEPQTLVRMAERVAGRTDRHQHVGVIADVDQTQSKHLIEHLIPHRQEGDLDRVDLMTPLSNGADKVAHDHAPATLDKRYICACDEDPHLVKRQPQARMPQAVARVTCEAPRKAHPAAAQETRWCGPGRRAGAT